MIMEHLKDWKQLFYKMKNSDKFKISLVSSILGALIVFVIYDDFEMFKILLYLILTICYMLFNLFVALHYPKATAFNGEKYVEYCKEWFNKANWIVKLSVVYWWKRFMFYLDYQLKQ